MILYTVVHPILLQESGSLQGNETVAVGRAVHPQGRVKTEVVVHCGTRHDRQAVAVWVIVGQLTVLQGLVTVRVETEVAVIVLMLVVVLTLTLTLVLVTVAVVVSTRM